MNQTLHIFKKDARRFWPEILASLAVTVLYIFLEPSQWTGRIDYRTMMIGQLARVLEFLIAGCWWVLICRVILAEKLVGDTQYWITRPYRWGSLLLAKLLFFLVFLFAPFFVMQCALLVEAGFAPHDHLPGLLFSLVLIGGVLVLPWAAIASVTSSFARVALTLLGIVLAFVCLLAVATFGISIGTGGTETSSSSTAVYLILAVPVIAAMVLQFALRREWLARGLLLAVPFLLVALSSIEHKHVQAQMDRKYPVANGNEFVRIAYERDANSHGTTGLQVSSTTAIPVSIPLSATGVPEGSVAILHAIRLQIHSADGSHWESEWQAVSQYYFSSDKTSFSPTVFIPVTVYRQFQYKPAAFHVQLAFVQAVAGKTFTVQIQRHTFTVPGFGVCAPQTGWAPELGHITGLSCFAPLSEPQLTHVSTYWSDEGCSGTPTIPADGVIGAGWEGTTDRHLAEFGISPIVQLQNQLSNSQRYNSMTTLRYLCPGTPVTFIQYTAGRGVQVSVEIPEFPLPKVSVEGNQLTVSE